MNLLYQAPRATLEEKVNILMQVWRLFNGEVAEFLHDEWHPIAVECYKRTRTKNAVKNHRLAVLNSPADRTEKLKEINIPTLIIHGFEDQIIKVEHSYYANKNIPNSKLVLISKMGHLLSSLFIKQVEDELLKHIEFNS